MNDGAPYYPKIVAMSISFVKMAFLCTWAMWTFIGDAFYDRRSTLSPIYFLNNGVPFFLPKSCRNANLVSINYIFQNLDDGSIHQEAISFLLQSFFG